ncbi:hypothetical protein C6503_20850 [Candidatus Poribacteria bacterium]|nr:MAG: hypothetical protein C6503_20850 [Candidatus Poribacteria bacterium]
MKAAVVWCGCECRSQEIRRNTQKHPSNTQNTQKHPSKNTPIKDTKQYAEYAETPKQKHPSKNTPLSPFIKGAGEYTVKPYPPAKGGV